MSEGANSAGHVALFQERAIRRTWHNNAWWFALADVVMVLAESTAPADYIRKMRSRDKDLAQGWGQIVTPLRIATEGGIQLINCASTEGLLRIIQSIPSPKAEPFKRWLAKVGYERIQEIENPELAGARARELYEAKGYPKPWIEKRLRSIAIRGELTDEWKQRGVKEGLEYGILTAEIASATFGVMPEGHRKIKGLAKLKTGDDLRDHMTDLELIFTMLGEASTTEIALNSSQLKNFPVLLPPLAEQRHIARILSTWDLSIATAERQVDKLREEKSNLTTQLLTGKRRVRLPYEKAVA